MELFKLVGTIALDGLSKFNSDIDGATSKASGLASALGNGVKGIASSVGSVAGKVTALAGKAIAATYTATTTAAGYVGKKALEGYANYEQLVGGVNTLFKESSQKVQDYAAEAYKTAGVSANTYMDQATAFSASLLQSLGGDTEAAADMVDMAIQDMSDNANKMGTDIAAIQTAYQGFAKQNYTTLDNLKLGYGGTKGEMKRLIADANALLEAQGEVGDLTIENFDDVIEAIHIIQNELGITGTTADEAINTITGSFNTAKASLQNLVSGLGNENADISGLFDQFVTSAEIAIQNVTPVIETLLENVGGLIAEKAPELIDAAFNLIGEYAPTLMQAGADLAEHLIQGIAECAPTLFEEAGKIADQLIDGIASGLEGTAFEPIGEALSGLKESIKTTFDTLKNEVDWDTIFGDLSTIVGSIVDGFGRIISTGTDLFAWISQKAGEEGSSINALASIIKSLATDGLDFVLSSLDGVVKLLTGDAAGAWASFQQAGESAIDLLEVSLEGIGTIITNFFTDLGLLDNKIDEVAQKYAGIGEEKQSPLPIDKNGDLVLNGQLSQGVEAFVDANGKTIMGDYVAENGHRNPNQTWVVPVTQDTGSGTKAPTTGKNKNEAEFYASGGILTEPTAFAINPYNGKTMIGGEDGAEAIAPISLLQGYVAEAVESKNVNINETLVKILEALLFMNENMPMMMQFAMENVSIKLNGREFGRAVRSY